MKQTALEWLVEQIFGDHTEQWQKEIEQALEMEKQQIMEAFQYKFFHPYVENEPEIYYNETYKKDNL
jgi:hypothetical protein